MNIPQKVSMSNFDNMGILLLFQSTNPNPQNSTNRAWIWNCFT